MATIPERKRMSEGPRPEIECGTLPAPRQYRAGAGPGAKSRAVPSGKLFANGVVQKWTLHGDAVTHGLALPVLQSRKYFGATGMRLHGLSFRFGVGQNVPVGRNQVTRTPLAAAFFTQVFSAEASAVIPWREWREAKAVAGSHWQEPSVPGNRGSHNPAGECVRQGNPLRAKRSAAAPGKSARVSKRI